MPESAASRLATEIGEQTERSLFARQLSGWVGEWMGVAWMRAVGVWGFLHERSQGLLQSCSCILRVGGSDHLGGVIAM